MFSKENHEKALAATEHIQPTLTTTSVSDSVHSTDLENQISLTDGNNDEKNNGTPTEPEYPSMAKVMVIMLALYLVIFLVALDRTIISTAIPRITDEFHDFGQVGWFGSAYLLTSCSFILLLGRIYTFYNTKWTFLTCITLFEVGSAVCGAAPNSVALIIGRAIAGAGAAGIQSGGIIIMIQILPLQKRPIFMAFFGLIFGTASVVGPLLGGVFTTDVSWRWCFYINLPIGAFAIAAVFFLLHVKPVNTELKTNREKIGSLDLLGTALFVPAIVCLLLALQWGGTTYAWSNWRIILCLVLFAILTTAFVGVQIWKGDKATISPRIISHRVMVTGVFYTFCTGSSMLLVGYYLPIWFQAIKGLDAVQSGIHNIPLFVAMFPSGLLAGFMVQKFGWYNPFMIASSIILPVGAGLLCTFTPTSRPAQWIGFQVVYGIGLGLGMQQPALAVQTNLPKKDQPTAISTIMFAQSLGPAIFLSVAQNLLVNKLASGLSSIQGLDVHSVTSIGATEFRNTVPASLLPRVIDVYNAGIVDVFYLATATACCLAIATAFMPWKNLKKTRGN